MPHPTDASYGITSTSPEAVAHYRKGVELVVRSSVEAPPVLAAAVAADDQMAVALVALAVAIGAGPEADVLLDQALARGRSATRRERQHVEIVVDAVRGDGRRARALAADHLAEFPGDALIAHLGAATNQRRPVLGPLQRPFRPL